MGNKIALTIYKRRQLAGVIASLSMLAGWPSMAFASEEARTLEVIVVTARKRQESLMDAPVAVTAVSGESLEKQGITSMEQLSAKVSGLQVGRAAQTSNLVDDEGGGLPTASLVNSGYARAEFVWVIWTIRKRWWKNLLMVTGNRVILDIWTSRVLLISSTARKT